MVLSERTRTLERRVVVVGKTLYSVTWERSVGEDDDDGVLTKTSYTIHGSEESGGRFIDRTANADCRAQGLPMPLRVNEKQHDELEPLVDTGKFIDTLPSHYNSEGIQVGSEEPLLC